MPKEAAVPPTFPFGTPPGYDNEPEADALLEQAPVVPARMGPIDVWLALSHRSVRQVFADGRFSREPPPRPGSRVPPPVAATPLLISSKEGEPHARVRKLMAQAFS